MFSTTGSSGWKKVLALIYPEDKEEKLKSSFVKCAVAKYQKIKEKMAALYEPEKVALKNRQSLIPKNRPEWGAFYSKTQVITQGKIKSVHLIPHKVKWYQ